MKRGKYNATVRRMYHWYAWLLGDLESGNREMIAHAGSETARAVCGACGITVSLNSPTELT